MPILNNQPTYWPDTGWVEGLHNIARSTVGNLTDLKNALVSPGEKKWYTAPLADTSAPYKAITGYLRSVAGAQPYKTKRFEAARLANQGKAGLKTVMNYAQGVGERTEFKPGAYTISEIRVIANADLWNNYENTKSQFGPNSRGWANPDQELVLGAGFNVSITGTSGKFSFPMIDKSIPECYLLHGTGKGTAKLIAENGFGPEYCKFRKLGGYGSLGQGSYLSDNLAKIASYTQCPSCNSYGACGCTNRDGVPEKRVAVIARALLHKDTLRVTKRNKYGVYPRLKYRNIEGTLGKPSQSDPTNVRFGADHPMVIGLKGNNFPNNVFLVRDKSLIYPEFLIFFQWPRGGFRRLS